MKRLLRWLRSRAKDRLGFKKYSVQSAENEPNNPCHECAECGTDCGYGCIKWESIKHIPTEVPK